MTAYPSEIKYIQKTLSKLHCTKFENLGQVDKYLKTSKLTEIDGRRNKKYE